IRLDLITVDPVSAAVVNIKQRLVGGEGDAVGEAEAGVDDFLFAHGADVPDFARVVAAAGVGDVDAAIVADGDVIAPDAFGDDGGGARGGRRRGLIRRRDEQRDA